MRKKSNDLLPFLGRRQSPKSNVAHLPPPESVGFSSVGQFGRIEGEMHLWCPAITFADRQRITRKSAFRLAPAFR